MVSRDQPEVDPSSDTHCTADFWDRLVQQPRYVSRSWQFPLDGRIPGGPTPAGVSNLRLQSHMRLFGPSPVAPFWMIPPLAGLTPHPPLPSQSLLAWPEKMSGCAAQRPEGEEGGPWPWEAAPTPQRLPSPKELCQKKRKGPKQKVLRHLRGLSVLYHLEEVKRRQSNIDKQKAAQEGGALPQLSPQRNGMVRDLPACLLSPARTPEPYARPFLGRGTGAQLLLHPQWNPNLREPRRFPEESPLAFYAVAAHHRSLHAGSTELLRPEE